MEPVGKCSGVQIDAETGPVAVWELREDGRHIGPRKIGDGRTVWNAIDHERDIHFAIIINGPANDGNDSLYRRILSGALNQSEWR